MLFRSSPLRRADGTLPRHSAGSEFEGRHRAERVLELVGAVVSVLDRLDREESSTTSTASLDASAFGLHGYVDTLSPLVVMLLVDRSCVIVGKF